jgi:putative hydrolase of the HAD superfamily
MTPEGKSSTVTIKAILFDLDDTLLVEVASAEAAFLSTCALAQVQYGVDAKALVQTVREEARTLWHASPARPYCLAVGISSWEGLWAPYLGDNPNLCALREWAPSYRHTSWTRALTVHGINDPLLAERLAQTFPRERRKLHIVYPDVAPTLRDLAQTSRLALITNGAPGLQREKLAGSGLAPYFDAVIISGEVGVGKPDPLPFRLALDGIGVTPEEAVMVGNSQRSDIAGARGAGIRGVWINRDGVQTDRGIEPDAQIADLGELSGVLSQMNDQG